MYKATFIFSKKRLMKYISHLDLMRLFQRAMRRADLPLKMTEGFSPHPKFSIKRALKLGLESNNEEATVVLKDSINVDEFKNRLQKQLPQGIYIQEVQILSKTEYGVQSTEKTFCNPFSVICNLPSQTRENV